VLSKPEAISSIITPVVTCVCPPKSTVTVPVPDEEAIAYKKVNLLLEDDELSITSDPLDGTVKVSPVPEAVGWLGSVVVSVLEFTDNK